MKSYKTIIAAVATGLACTAVTSQASFVPASPTLTAPIPGGSDFNALAAGSLLTTLPSSYSFGSGADTGTLTTDVYAYKANGIPLPSLPLSGGYVFIFTLVISSGSVSSLTLGGFSGPVMVNNGVGTATDSYQAVYDTSGGITFSWLVPQTAGNTLKVVVDTSSTAWKGGISTVRATTDLSGTASSLTSVVPEPSTVVAGALMLLPFGIGAIRSLRKNRTA